MVFVGGMCVFGINYGGSVDGVFIDNVGVLIIDFFVNLIDMVNIWYLVEGGYEVCDCVLGFVKWIVFCVDLIFGLNFILCVYVEFYV